MDGLDFVICHCSCDPAAVHGRSHELTGLLDLSSNQGRFTTTRQLRLFNMPEQWTTMNPLRNGQAWNFMGGAFVDNIEGMPRPSTEYQHGVGGDPEGDYCTCSHNPPHPSPVQPESPNQWAAPGVPRPSFPIPRIPAPQHGAGHDSYYHPGPLPFPEPASNYGQQHPLAATFTSNDVTTNFYGNYIPGMEYVGQYTESYPPMPISRSTQPTTQMRPVVYVMNHIYMGDREAPNVTVDSTPDHIVVVNTRDHVYNGYENSEVCVNYGATV